MLCLLWVLSIPFCQRGEKHREDQIAPSDAFVALLTEAWGCLQGQEKQAEVKEAVSSMSGGTVTLRSFPPSEDVIRQQELLLLFPAEGVNLEGFLVLKIWLSSDDPGREGLLTIDEAGMYPPTKGQTGFSCRVRGSGMANAALYYTRAPRFRQAWFSCPEAGQFELYPVSFFCMYPEHGFISGTSAFELSPAWQSWEMSFGAAVIEGIKNTDDCQRLLMEMEKAFGSPEEPLMWEVSGISSERMAQLAEKVYPSTEGQPFQILLTGDSGTRIALGDDRFVPHLQQKLALVREGRKEGGELWLARKE